MFKYSHSPYILHYSIQYTSHTVCVYSQNLEPYLIFYEDARSLQPPGTLVLTTPTSNSLPIKI